MPRIHRISFVVMLALGVSLSACAGAAEQPTEAPSDSAAELDATAPPEVAATEEDVAEPTAAEDSEDQDAGEAEVIVGDVIDFSLEPREEWADTGAFGWVQFELHTGSFDGETVSYIRTDASDEAFAVENGLVHVPILANALATEGATADLYLLEGGPAVFTVTPESEAFTPAFHLVRVVGAADGLDNAAAVEAAADAGEVSLEETNIVVNYPVVEWPGGSLPVDTALDSYLGTGQIIEMDAEAGTVTFKLHECYSGARYIVTDTSAAAMAPMMSLAPSPATQLLVDAGAVDAISVFANGIEGSGVMGYQPAVFRNEAGSPAWSPFWDHFTLQWNEDAEPRVLTSQADIQEAIDNGEVTLFNGTPDTHPDGFVVNCPVPVLAPNTFGE